MHPLYDSATWQSFENVDRAQLLLVLEGLKRGTIIEGSTSFQKIITNAGLVSEQVSPQYRLYPTFLVARKEDIEEKRLQRFHLFQGPQRKDLSIDFHKIGGWILSYPACCTEEYARERTLEEEKYRMERKHHLTYLFGRQLTALIEKGEEYSELFDYRPPSFTPCSIECPSALELLASWKHALDTYDPEAAKGLKRFNRQGYPERLAHEEFWEQEKIRQREEWKLRQLRSSILG